LALEVDATLVCSGNRSCWFAAAAAAAALQVTLDASNLESMLMGPMEACCLWLVQVDDVLVVEV